MANSGEGTQMIHYECGVCAVEATIVETNAGILAWHDHMAIHVVPSDFRSWTWRVYELPLGND